MQWLEITIETASAGIEELASALSSGGFSDLIIEDQAEFENFLEDNRAYWDYIDEQLQQTLQGLSRIKLYLEDTDKAGLTRLETLVAGLKEKNTDGRLGSLSMKADLLPDTDWEESWKENYPPQPVGEKLVVLPYWLADNCPEDRLPVILDPGLTFGTGAHPSTRMVLETMEHTITLGDACLDLGSGSGILSIAALRLGAARAVGVDIDPKAEDIARENAAYNGIGSEFTALTGNVLSDRKLMDQLKQDQYRVVLVNIVADVIISLAPVLPGFLHDDSLLICSGILETRLDHVKAALEGAGLTILDTKAQEEWRCVIARR